MKRAWLPLIAGAVAIVASLVALVVLAGTLTDRGLTADAEGTAGYTTSGEIVLGLAALAGLLAGLTLVMLGIVRFLQSRSTPA